jgi:hypothetical protein
MITQTHQHIIDFTTLASHPQALELRIIAVINVCDIVFHERLIEGVESTSTPCFRSVAGS